MNAKNDFKTAGDKTVGKICPEPLSGPLPTFWKWHCWFDQQGVKHCERRWHG